MKVLTVRRADRFAGAAFAIFVQAGLLVLLLSSRPLLAPPPALVRELTLILPRLRELEPIPIRPSPERAPRPRAAPLSVTSALPNSTAPVATPPDFGKLGQSIFGCAPENYASLTPSQRALCSRPSEGVAIQQAPNLMGVPSQSSDEAHWHHQWVVKESPLLLPGASPDHFGLSLYSSRADVATLTNPHPDGADPDSTATYAIAQPAPEDFYKAERAYDAWNKAHGGK